MGLETGTYISDLVTTNPTASDALSQADDHLRLLKTAVQNSFPKDLRGVSEPRVGDTLRYNGTSFANGVMPRLFHSPLIANANIVPNTTVLMECSTNAATLNTIGFVPVNPYIAMTSPADDLICSGQFVLTMQLTGTPSAYDYIEVYLHNGDEDEILTEKCYIAANGTPYSGMEFSGSGVLVPNLTNCANVVVGTDILLRVGYFAHSTSDVTSVSIDDAKSYISLQELP